MSDPIISQSTLISIPQGGPQSSEVLQRFADNTVVDIQTLTRAVNAQEGELQSSSVTLSTEVEHIRSSIRGIESNQANLLKAAKEYIQTLDFYTKKDVSYAANTSETNKLVVDHKYGSVYLPAIGYTPVFHTEDNSGNIQEIANLQFGVTPTEPIMAGFPQTIETTTPDKAVNGQNSSAWVRTVSYPLEAPITEVTATFEVSLGNTNETKRFNTVRINPYPVERVDILGIWYKSTASSSWTLLEQFPQTVVDGIPTPVAINNADHVQYIGQIRNVFAAKIQIRQRNWIELNNKKTFIYGLQELDFKFVEFSTQNSSYSLSDLSANNHAIIKVTAPAGNVFKTLLGLEASPLVNLEGTATNDNHILLYVSKSPSIANSEVLWKSNSYALPQDLPVDLTVLTDPSVYYLIIMMKYVDRISSSLSPFDPKTSPVLEGITIRHQLQTTAATAEEAVNATDLIPGTWTERNWAVHKMFVSHMDIYKSTVENGSNVFVFGDDFWAGYTHRDLLDGVIISPKLMSLTTTTSSPNATGTITYKTVSVGAGVNPVVPFTPRKLRIQSVHNKPNASQIYFKINYNSSLGPLLIPPSSEPNGIEAKNSGIQWYDIEGDMTDFTLSIDLINSAGNDQPVLGQFILILKD